MFNPMIPTLPKLPNPFGYLDQLKTYYQQRAKAPTFRQTAPPFTPQIPALRPLTPLNPGVTTSPNAPKMFTPTPTVKPKTPTQPEASSPFPTAPTPYTPSPFPTTPAPSNGGSVSTTYQYQPVSGDTWQDGTMKVTMTPGLSQQRIANTLRQVPENLREAWNTLGQDWWSQFSTWQQDYVNRFLEQYAAGNFDAANEVATSWYAKKDAYAKNNGTKEQQQAEQDYFDQQSQYRQSGYIG